MKCRLCDRPTATGAGKLCPDCAKALQRARGATLRKLATLEPGGAVSAAAVDLPPTVAPGAVASLPSRRPAVWVAIGLAAIAILYAGQRELARHRGADPVLVAPVASAERSAAEAPAVVPQVEEPSWTAVANPDPVVSNGKAENNGAMPVASATASTKGGARGASTRNASQDSKSASFSVASRDEPVATPNPEPVPQLASASIVASPQPADGAQILASAMERCGNERLLSKFVCEQKTYLEYCEDKWDKDPRCQRRTTSSR